MREEQEIKEKKRPRKRNTEQYSSYRLLTTQPWRIIYPLQSVLSIWLYLCPAFYVTASFQCVYAGG